MSAFSTKQRDLKKFTFVPAHASFLKLFLLYFMASSVAWSMGLELPACEKMVQQTYQGKLPMMVAINTQRRDVRCVQGVSKPALIEHHDHVLEEVEREVLERMIPSIRLTGMENALVRRRCAQSIFRDFLAFADVEFHIYAKDEFLGAVRITADICNSSEMAPQSFQPRPKQ